MCPGFSDKQKKSNLNNAILIFSKRPVKLFPEIPMHSFDRGIFIQGITAKFSSFAAMSKLPCPEMIDRNQPIPDCFFPPKGTLLLRMLY